LTLWRQRILTLIPLAAIAWLAQSLANHPTISGYGLSALTLAIGAGMVAANTMPKEWLMPCRGCNLPGTCCAGVLPSMGFA
jgi:uncharacterized membrane protein YadS